MKKLALYTSKLEAELAAQFLESNGLNAEVRGIKEYISHVIGGDLGRYELFVDGDYFERAKVLIEERNANEVKEPQIIEAKTYFKKSLIFAIMAAVLFPLIFNYVSIRQMMLFYKTEKSKAKRNTLTALLILMQLPTLCTLKFLLLRN